MAPDATDDGNDEEYLCEKHDVKESPYSDSDVCPYCEEERHVEAMHRERMERRASKNMHPNVDARRR